MRTGYLQQLKGRKPLGNAMQALLIYCACQRKHARNLKKV